jgi:hypothetical protein
MFEPAVLHEGVLGEHAAKKLAAIDQAKARLDAEASGILALVAEAHGFVLNGCRVKFDYDPGQRTYKVVGGRESEEEGVPAKED